MIHVDFQMLRTLLENGDIQARLPIMIRGPHGIGKSQIPKWLAPKLAKLLGLENPNYVYPIIERRASQMPDAGDLMGLPQLQGDVTRFCSMEWFHEACIKPVILFFDEVDRGNQDVKQALMELTDSRKLAGHNLHPDTIIIAAVNGGEGDTQYTVGEFDPAELDRWIVYDVRPTVADWIQWAQEAKVADVIVEFIRANEKFLEHKGEFAPNKVYPSRRSWDRLNQRLSHNNWLDTCPIELQFMASAGVGNEAAIAFYDFVKNYDKQVSLEDVIIKGKIDLVKKMSQTHQMGLVEKMKESKLILERDKLNKDQKENLVGCFLQLEPEIAMMMFEVISGANNKLGVELHQMSYKGSSFSKYISEILLGKAKKGS